MPTQALVLLAAMPALVPVVLLMTQAALVLVLLMSSPSDGRSRAGAALEKAVDGPRSVQNKPQDEQRG